MNIFEKYPKATLFIAGIVLSLVGLFTLEKLAGSLGLGDVVVYESNPLYGYRPKPNQSVKRFHQVKLCFNNLGLRAKEDWDLNKKEKYVLFLGDSVTYGGSYIDNEELFSTLAVKSLPNVVAGNAGVNAWGILNVYGLV